jgi:hypothetical protein
MHPVRQSLGDTGLIFSGRLTRNAEAAHKIIDGLHDVPILIMDLESDTGMHMPLHVEQPFPIGAMDQAKAAARRYRKGQHVTVQAPALSIRVAVTATHIHTDKENETEPCPPSPSSP